MADTGAWSPSKRERIGCTKGVHISKHFSSWPRAKSLPLITASHVPPGFYTLIKLIYLIYLNKHNYIYEKNSISP